MAHIDYLLIGHITCDITPDGNQVGGTVTYSGRTATTLGCHTAVLTSCAAGFDGLAMLAGLDVVNIPSSVTSTFENIYTADGRTQTLHAAATDIHVSDLPAEWRQPTIVHLAPLANEVDTAFIHQFPDSLIGLTPQGWLRGWGEDGRVYPKKWQDAEAVLPLADVVVLSQEDLVNIDMLWDYWAWSKLLVLTGGANGCLVIQGETATRVPAVPVKERDATGAGDIFATAYLIHYQQTGDPFEAARFANYVAAHSVTCVGIDALEKKLKPIVNNYE